MAANTTQAKRTAADARRTMDERRRNQTGAAGWVADRPRHGALEGPDYGFEERRKLLGHPLRTCWFRMEVEGWERIAEPPVLLVGIHSGAPFVWDAWTIG